MEATESQIKAYIERLYMFLDLDWNGYLALRLYEKECLEKGQIIPLK